MTTTHTWILRGNICDKNYFPLLIAVLKMFVLKMIALERINFCTTIGSFCLELIVPVTHRNFALPVPEGAAWFSVFLYRVQL